MFMFEIQGRKTRVLLQAAMLNLSVAAFGTVTMAAPMKPVITDISMLQDAKIEILARHEETGVGFARITPEQEKTLNQLAHERRKCGGFEALPDEGLEPNGLILTHVFGQLADQEAKNRRFTRSMSHFRNMEFRPEIQTAIDQVSEDNLRSTVEFLSAYPSRVHSASNPNVHVDAMKTRVEQMLANAKVQYQVELVSHTRTKQKSLRVRIPGTRAPNEIVVLGAHLDSINQDWFGSKEAPGADDNASGSSNILEALRILSQGTQPERTIELMWYAGEEGGLIGSAEIAKDYKSQNKDVVGVLQLDMTLFAGDGEFVLGSMTDFTSAWMRGYLETLNGLYIKARIVDDKCGYGCSDHASWHRQGYPALMPFESSFGKMNHNLHTTKDRIDANSNFRHAATFTKIALAIAMDLGNSTLREPK